MADETAETPYALAKRLHSQGAAILEIERALRERGLDEDEARIAARAGRGEAGFSLAVATPGAPQSQPVELPSEPPAETPTHPCPLHAAWPVVGTCTRCGKFFCARCLKDAGFVRAPESNQCPTCEARFPHVQGIGGWLVLPALHVTLVGPLSALVGLGQDAMAVPEVSGPLLAPVVVEMLANASYLALAIFAAIAFFQKKRRAVPLMISFYTAAMLLAVLSLVLTGWIESIAGTPVGEQNAGVQVGRAFISSLVWIAYFAQSKRVKATFIVP